MGVPVKTAEVVDFVASSDPLRIGGYGEVAEQPLTGRVFEVESRLCQWLGLISFSLYLTQEPIVIALAYIFGPGGGVACGARRNPVVAVCGTGILQAHRVAKPQVGPTSRNHVPQARSKQSRRATIDFPARLATTTDQHAPPP
ncbi:hypothetical protein CITRIK5_110018 [Citricoccus sp. K5]|nr:hypothetical protein CITRIK5_110018 [Citricoccus sp. K5]